jgi:hypothetical protein
VIDVFRREKEADIRHPGGVLTGSSDVVMCSPCILFCETLRHLSAVNAASKLLRKLQSQLLRLTPEQRRTPGKPSFRAAHH